MELKILMECGCTAENKGNGFIIIDFGKCKVAHCCSDTYTGIVMYTENLHYWYTEEIHGLVYPDPLREMNEQLFTFLNGEDDHDCRNLLTHILKYLVKMDAFGEKVMMRLAREFFT